MAILLLAGAVAFPTASRSTSVDRLSDQDLVSLSSMIVEGRVTGVRSEWTSDHTQIHTIVTIRVSTALKGAAPGNGLLVLRLLGGQVGDTVMELIGGPTFVTDEEVIVFVEAGGPELMPITGLFQGKFTVTTDAVSGARVISERQVPRDAFVEQISRMVVEQEGGR